ncbi:MAG: GAF domain-containing protein [Chloroflexi bacterium]|nr:GAF domain-containing protein [Chloroflexota bacterium]
MTVTITANPIGTDAATSDDLALQLAAKEAELEALRQEQAATTEVLRAIGRSGFDLRQVLQTLVDAAGELCRADTGNISLARESYFVEVPAWFRPPASIAGQGRVNTISDTVRNRRIRVGDRHSLLGRVGAQLGTVHIPDTQADAEYRSPFAGAQMIRTALGVPLLGTDGTLIGVLVMNRYRPEPYTGAEVALVERFAGQAVIAIENARLYADAERRRAESDALALLVREGTLRPEPDDVLHLAAGSARDILKADYAAIGLHQVPGRLEWRSASGNLTDGWARLTELASSSSVDQALAAGELAIAEHIGDDPAAHSALLALHEAEGGRTAMMLPLTAQGAAFGCLAAGWRTDQGIAPALRDLAETLAGYVAIVVDSAQTHAEAQRRARELEQLNDELEQRVADRTAELTASYKELEAFSYTVSHDLRAPLRGIDGFSQVLLEDYARFLDEQAREYLGRVRAASQRMGRMIDSILGLSRVARRELRREPLDLSQLAADIARELKDGDPGRDVECVIAPGLRARGDRDLLRLALQNLFDNAWKFTSRRANGCIEFCEVQREGERVFCVKDNGAGFDMQYVDTLFRVFTRLHTTSEFPGEGVGLASVQRIIRRHGGRIWAEGAVGRGASFFFTLEEGA